MLKEAHRTAVGLAVPTILLTSPGCQTTVEDLYTGSRGVYTLFEAGEEGNIRYHGRATLERPRCVFGVDPQNVYTLRRRTGGSGDMLGLGDVRIDIHEGDAVQESGKIVLGKSDRAVPMPTRKNPLSVYDSEGRFLRSVRGGEWLVSVGGEWNTKKCELITYKGERALDSATVPPGGTVRIGSETVYHNSREVREKVQWRDLQQQLRQWKEQQRKEDIIEDIWPLP